MLIIVLALEAWNYRSAVLDANIDRKRAWNTVVELRRQCGPQHAAESPRKDPSGGTLTTEPARRDAR